MLENPTLSAVWFLAAHKSVIPTAVPMLSGLSFSMAMTFMSLGVAVTPEVNMAVKKAETYITIPD